METRFRRYSVPALLGFLLVVGVLSGFSLFQRIGSPFGGFLIRMLEGGGYAVDWGTPAWWPGMSVGGLRYGDKLLEVNGQPFDSRALEIYAESFRNGDTSATLLIQRNGEILIKEQTPIVQFTLSNFIDRKTPLFICGLVAWLLSLATFVAEPNGRNNRAFAVAWAMVVPTQWFIGADVALPATPLANAIEILWAGTTPLLPAALMWAGYNFVRRERDDLFSIDRVSPGKLEKLLFFIAVIAMGVGICLTGVYVFERYTGLQGWHGPEWSALEKIVWMADVWLDYLGMAGIGLVIFVDAYMRRNSPRGQRQLKILGAGLGLLLPISGFAFAGLSSNGLLGGQLIAGFDFSDLVMAVVVLMAYIVLRYRAYQASNWLFSLALMLAVSFWIAKLTAVLIRNAAPNEVYSVPPLILVFGACFVCAFVWGNRTIIEHLFGRVMQWESLTLNSAGMFVENLAGRSGFVAKTQAAEYLARAANDALNIECARVWIREQIGELRLAGNAGSSNNGMIQIIKAPASLLLAAPTVMDRRAIKTDSNQWLEPVFINSDIEKAVLLIARSEVLGVMALGRRKDEEMFDLRDEKILALVGQVSSLFLQNAYQIDELRDVPKRISDAQERERFRLAQELHDSIQQFLGILPFEIERSMLTMSSEPRKAENILRASLTDIKRASQTLREIRGNLAPRQLDNGLRQPLTTLIERFQERTGIFVDFQAQEDFDAGLSIQKRHGLFRVIQQALDNVAEHAEATKVFISLEVVGKQLEFSVLDDGHGFLFGSSWEKNAIHHSGLTGMRDRVMSFDGYFEILSEPGNGVALKGWLPVGD